MRGYCPDCREYRNRGDAWGIKKSKFGATCGRCGAILDVIEVV